MEGREVQMDTHTIDEFFDELQSDMIGGGSIPLHNPLCFDYIQAGLLSEPFVNYFRICPYSEYKTSRYKFTIRRVDSLINMRIWKI